MVVKTITVTEEAYNAIKSLKRPNESFSELFKRVGDRPLRIRDIAGALKQTPEEAEAFRKRVLGVREELGKGLDKRINYVRARFKRNN